MPYFTEPVRSRVRSVGADVDLPHLEVFHLPGVAEDHLHPDVLDSGPRPLRRTVSLLDADLRVDCTRCLGSPQSPAVHDAINDVMHLSTLVSALDEVGGFVDLNDPSLEGELEAAALGRSLSECSMRIGEIEAFAKATSKTFSSTVSASLVSRVEALRTRIVELLRSPEGLASLQAELALERMVVPQEGVSLFALGHGFSGVHRAALFAFGTELAPGRFLVEGSELAVGALGQVAVCTSVVTEGFSPEVVATAIALWDPISSGPLLQGMNALKAASLLLSTSSSNA